MLRTCSTKNEHSSMQIKKMVWESAEIQDRILTMKNNLTILEICKTISLKGVGGKLLI